MELKISKMKQLEAEEMQRALQISKQLEDSQKELFSLRDPAEADTRLELGWKDGQRHSAMAVGTGLGQEDKVQRRGGK